MQKLICRLSGFSPSALEDDDEEDGHTVVATARGVFNSNGGVLSSIETGVSIIIPQGAIPEGIEQEIYFKVCRDNSILPPLDKEKGRSKHWDTAFPSGFVSASQAQNETRMAPAVFERRGNCSSWKELRESNSPSCSWKTHEKGPPLFGITSNPRSRKIWVVVRGLPYDFPLLVS